MSSLAQRTLRGLAAVCGCLITLSCVSWSQEKPARDAWLDAFEVRCIGPANMGGRIVDLDVVDSDPDTMYIAAATGGLWKTTNGGGKWTPLLDEVTTSLGAVAVAPSNPDVVWTGGGEANPRNSVTWGLGVFKSTDAGKSWQHMGLAETHHIGRIAIHPKNPDVVYVAALGHVWGPNKERGLFKTSDAGKTWEHVLNLGAETGCIDVTLDPAEPDIVYAAAYATQRDTFSGGNPAKQFSDEAGLYRSVDGGKKFERMKEGLPAGPYGRCGLSVYRKDPSVVYAVVQTAKTPATVQGAAANGKLNLESGGIFRSDDKGKTWTHLNSLCPRPFYYGQIRVDPSDEQRIYVLGVSFHVSSDGGKTFGAGAKGVHPDHHAMWINPKDSQHLVLGNDGGLYFSKNRGTAWEPIRGMALAQFYAIGVDMRRPYRVYGGLQDNGSWGGPSATRTFEGITLNDWYRVGGGDGFYCAVDPTDPDVVYAESQYGNLRRVSVKSLLEGKAGKGGGGKSIRPGGVAKGKEDGDDDDNDYVDCQEGEKGKDEKGKDADKGKEGDKTKEGDKKEGDKTGGTKGKGGSGYRFNWCSPLLISPHDPQTIFYGGQFLFKSTNRGDKWETISPDLTGGKLGMATSGHTLTVIAESPVKAGILYTGSDTGKLFVSRDDGKNWTDLTDKLPLPKNGTISRVECSYQDEATAYVTVDRRRNDDRTPYIFKTTDYGATFKPLAGNLPKEGSVYVIRESSRNPSLLFAGTEHGVFVSRDGGGFWQPFGKGLPIVAVHDLVIHPRDRELVIATHGRGVYVVDVSPLEEINDKVLAGPFHLFKVGPAIAYTLRKSDKMPTPKSFVAANPPLGARISFFLKEPTTEPTTIMIADKAGKTIAEFKGPTKAGLHHLLWDLRLSPTAKELVAAGDYEVRLRIGTQTLMSPLKVEAE